MHSVVALVRAALLSALSYRLRMALSLASVLLTVIPVYFISDALQPVLASALRGEGEQYFAFLIVGTGALLFLTTALTTLPGAIGTGITTGTWEAMLATPAHRWSLLAGMSGYAFLWSAAKAIALLLTGMLLGARIVWGGMLPAAVVLLLTIIPYYALGLVSAGAVLAWRTRTPVAQLALLASVFLGGVYYPTHLVPGWLERLSAWIPLTYGLRALRQLLLEGASLPAVLPDLEVLLLFDVVFVLIGTVVFAAAMRHARRAGTLAQY